MQKKQITIVDAIWKKVRKVKDPELLISIVEMGLIYDIKVKNDKAQITMTLTTIGCPLFSIIEGQVKSAVLSVTGINSVLIKLTFDPPWSMDNMSEKARAEIGI